MESRGSFSNETTGPNNVASTSSVSHKPYAKGQRSSQACDTCHARKTRCSGEVPCKFCVSRNIPCVVSDSASRSNAKRPRLSSSKSPSSSNSQHQSMSSIHHITASVMDPPPSVFTKPERRATQLFSPSGMAHLPLGSIVNNPSQQQPLSQPGMQSASYPSNLPSHLTSPSLSPHLQLQQLQQSQQQHQSPYMPSATAKPDRPFNHNPSPSGLSNVSLTETNVAPQDNEHSVSGIILTRYQRPPSTISEPCIPKLLDRRSSVKFFDAYFAEAEFIYQLHPIPELISNYHEAVWSAWEDGASSSASTVPVGMTSVLTALLALGAIFERRFEESERLYRAARESYLEIIDLATLESVLLAMQLAIYQINTSRSKSLWSSLAVAVRLSHCLNLHRKPALDGKSPEEALRRCQLWYNCYVHDCWLSLSSGRPALSMEGDSDLDPPWLPASPDQQRLVSSPIFGMRVRLSSIWTNIHDQLYRRGSLSIDGVPWLEKLPPLEDQLQSWSKDMHALSAVMLPQRSDKKQIQTIFLGQAIMRLIMHRSFLIQRNAADLQAGFAHQRKVSEDAVLDGALTVIDTCKKLIHLGIHLSFWFLTVDLQIACLALCEYLQNHQNEIPAIVDISKPEAGLQTATDLLQIIADSGENPAVASVLEAVKSIQGAWTYQVAQSNQQLDGGSNTQLLSNQLSEGLNPGATTSEAPLPFVNGAETSDFFGAPSLDFDWLNNLGAGGNIFDGFVASPAPAAENLAWWIAPRGGEMSQLG